MSIGYDVAELIAALKEKDAQIAHLVPNNFTELESRLTIHAIREIHTPDRATRAMHKDAASAIQKIQVIIDGFEAKRRADTELIASFTEEERQLILRAHANKSHPR